MSTDKASEKPKSTMENPSFDTDGPWANAWCMDPETFASKGRQMQTDQRTSKETKRFSRHHSASS
jgi:hypothetical protein